ncbi:pseudouridine synthase [Novilysobacter erysipheiresistens]|uniref:Pseudouridine synthase n=1 Tax=Novilysobacter erysipheiresistens TaxID=1749332 RepID=A0ABU7Z0W0_9GAMM
MKSTPWSRLQLPPGAWTTLLDGLCARFPAIDRTTWLDRFARGRVLDARGEPVAADATYRVGMEIRYFREVRDESVVPFEMSVLHVDEHLVVVDKPHFLPVTPAGGFVDETVLARLVARLGNSALVPLHRIDRGTAGLVMFSANPESRARYQALFREGRIEKRYEAVAAPLPGLEFPWVRRSRLVRGEPFFRMVEVEGEANSESRIEVIERGEVLWRYGLQPVTGKKHQLRVHMAALGAPIVGDPFYPVLREQGVEDYGRPLQLLARSLRFVDPLSGELREFESERRLVTGLLADPL